MDVIDFALATNGSDAAQWLCLRDRDGLVGFAPFCHTCLADLEPLLGLAAAALSPQAFHFDALARAYSPAARRAAAAIETALWDLLGKERNEPLWRMLGGSDAPIRMHCKLSERPSGGTCAAFPSAMVDARPTVDETLDLLQAITSAHGCTEFMLRLAPAPDIASTIEFICEVERSFDLVAVEVPDAFGDADDTRRISDAIAAAVMNPSVACDMNCLVDHFRARSLNIIQVDVREIGITEALRVSDVAYGLELPAVIAECPGDIGVHLFSAMPYSMSVGTSRADSRLESGWLPVGDTPGHGVTPDTTSAAFEALPLEVTP